MDVIMSLDDLKTSFQLQKVSFNDDLLLQKCLTLCNRLSIPSKQFAADVSAFLVNNSLESLSLAVFGKFELSQTSKYTMKKKTLVDKSLSYESPSYFKSNTTNNKRLINHDSSMTPSDSFKKIGKTENQLSFSSSIVKTANNNSSYHTRLDRGKSLNSFNEHLEARGFFEPSSKGALGLRCKIREDSQSLDNIKSRYRYMFTPLEERARVLDKHLLQIQIDMCKFLCIEDSELSPMGIPSQENIWVCGRITCDTEGKINSESILLEGSRQFSHGRKVPLNIKDIPAYSLFPGQIVMVEGVNSSGRSLVAKRIVEGIPKPLPMTEPNKLLEYNYSKSYQNGTPLNVYVAHGPFTTSENLLYEPLNDLFQKIMKNKPDVVILIGPFVDITQPLLSSGDVILEDDDIEAHNASYEAVFIEKIVRDLFRAIFNADENLPVQFILVPSLLDAHHDFVFPQPPFCDRDPSIKTTYFDEPIGELNIPHSKNDSKQRIHLMSNPCMFRINEILFGVTSQDVLFSLSSDETSLNVGNHRLTRLAGHILQQQSFCPQFPMPQGALSQVDLRQASHYQMSASPDILILPSKLTQMTKEVFGTLVINPGSLARGNLGGTFAEITINPMNEDKLRDQLIANVDKLPHEIVSRTRVDIIKI